MVGIGKHHTVLKRITQIYPCHRLSVKDEAGYVGMMMKPVASRRMSAMTAQNTEAPKTISVPEAGKRYFGLGRNGSYEAAKRGDIPTIKVGKLLRAVVQALERKLEQAGRA
jgi:hypothetical protein